MSNKQNDTLIEARLEAEHYHQMERIARELKVALLETKNEPGMSIHDVVNVIAKVFQPEEVLKIKELL